MWLNFILIHYCPIQSRYKFFKWQLWWQCTGSIITEISVMLNWTNKKHDTEVWVITKFDTIQGLNITIAIEESEIESADFKKSQKKRKIITIRFDMCTI